MTTSVEHLMRLVKGGRNVAIRTIDMSEANKFLTKIHPYFRIKAVSDHWHQYDGGFRSTSQSLEPRIYSIDVVKIGTVIEETLHLWHQGLDAETFVFIEGELFCEIR